MNCEQARSLIQPFADDELDAIRTSELRLHLGECRACAQISRNLEILKKAVKREELLFSAPPELRRQIKAELRSQIGTQPEQRFWKWNWLAAATSSAALACLALLLFVTFTRPSPEQQLAQEIVSSHVRSLMANHELDVASTDQHTVKPWFAGKLDFSPPVKDLAAQGFPLIGGRLDYLGGRAVAALVCQRNKHVINLFIWPGGQADSPPRPLAAIKGFNLVQWSKGQMTFWVVSDLNAKELMEFAQTYGN